MSELVDLKRDGRIVTVTFGAGDGLNALSIALMETLRDVARKLIDDADVSAVILQGKGDVFSAGADLKDPALLERATASLSVQRQMMKLGPDMTDAFEAIEAYTIAAIEGFCIGGGSALVAACDWRIAAENAYFRLPEIPLGMNMSWHSIPRLTTQMGPARAKRYVIAGEKIPAAQAVDWGLAEEVCAPGTAHDTARALADKIAALPPVPVRMSKVAVNAAAGAMDRTATYMDRDQFLLAMRSEDQKEALAAFLEKRPPRFKGQ